MVAGAFRTERNKRYTAVQSRRHEFFFFYLVDRTGQKHTQIWSQNIERNCVTLMRTSASGQQQNRKCCTTSALRTRQRAQTSLLERTNSIAVFNRATSVPIEFRGVQIR